MPLISRFRDSMVLLNPSSKSTVVPTTPRALIIPEVLELILSFLSPFKRRIVASLVCRQWRTIVRHFSSSTLFTWVATNSKDERLRVLQHASTTARTLVLQGHPKQNNEQGVNGDMPVIPYNPDPWGTAPFDELVRFLQQPETEKNVNAGAYGNIEDTDVSTNNKGKNKAVQMFPALRELVISHPFSTENRVLLLLDLLGPSLRILRLEQYDFVLPSLIVKILAACPRLDTLIILATPDAPVEIPDPSYLIIEKEQDVWTSLMHSNELTEVSWHLRTLVIQRLIFTTNTIEFLSCSFRSLIELRVLDGVLSLGFTDFAIVTSQGTAQIPVRMDMKKLLVQLNQSCPQLQRLQLSIREQSQEDLALLILHKDLFPSWTKSYPQDLDLDFPALTEFSLLDQHLSSTPAQSRTRCTYNRILSAPETFPALLRATTTLPRRWAFGHLTRIEFLPKPYSSQWERHSTFVDFGRGLHLLLCHAPQLEHLIAPHVLLDFDDLDWNRAIRGDKKIDPSGITGFDYDTYHTKIKRTEPPTHIWSCRRLKTLHVAFPIVEGRTNSPWSLVMFGYLSRACPRLRDLQIMKANFDFSAKQSGFCLLGRLRDLERMVLVTKSLPETKGWNVGRDLGWIRRLPKRRYPESITSPSLMLAFPQVIKNRGTTTAFAHNARDRGLGDIDFSSLGRPQDLVDRKQERLLDSKRGIPLWPLLEKFEIQFESSLDQMTGREMEMYLRRIREDVQVDIRLLVGKGFPQEASFW